MNCNKIISLLLNPYVYSVLTKVTMLIVGFLYTVILARYLGTDINGQFSYVVTLAHTSVIVCSIGIHQAYPFYKKQGLFDVRNLFPRIVVVLFVFYSIISLVIILFWGLDSKVNTAIGLIPLLTVSKLVAYQVMIEQPNKKNTCELLCEIVELIVIVCCLFFFESSLYIAVFILTGKNILAILYYLKVINPKFDFSRSDIAVLKKFVYFGILPMLALLMNNLNYRLDIIMLKGNVSFSQIGIYSVGIMLAEKVWLVSEALRDVLYSKLAKGKDSEEVNKIIRISISVCFVVNIGLLALGKPFIILFFGEDYSGAYEPLIIVLCGTLMMVYYKIIQTYNIVHGKQKTNFVLLSLSVLSNVVLNLIFIPIWGINGAAFASLISYSICALLFIIEYKRASGSTFSDLCFLKKEDLKIIMNIFKK